MLKEITESISSGLKERTSSPILGSYTVAAIACNWKSLVILFTSNSNGIELVEEVSGAYPGIYQSLAYPLVFALVFSVVYPTLKAMISTFNISARIIELKAEYRLEVIKEKISIKRNDVESIISLIENSYEKIGYHDLKRIKEILPDEDELLINQPNKSIQPTANASAD